MGVSPSYVPVRRTGGAGVFDEVTVSGTVTTQGRLVDPDWHPEDHGFETWTHDPAYPASSVSTVAGRVYVVRLPVRRVFTLARVWWGISTPGVTPTAGQSHIGVYAPDGTLISSAGIDAQVTGSGSQSTVLTGEITPPWVRVAFLFNAATPPGLVRGSSFETTPSINLPTTGLRAAVVASGATALPASFDPSTLTTSGSLTLFAALESA